MENDEQDDPKTKKPLGVFKTNIRHIIVF